MVDDLLLFSLPCFCRGAAPIGAVVIRKVTEARVRPLAPGSGSLWYYPSAWRRDEAGGEDTKLERIALVAEIVETALSRHLFPVRIANPASSFRLKRDRLQTCSLISRRIAIWCILVCPSSYGYISFSPSPLNMTIFRSFIIKFVIYNMIVIYNMSELIFTSFTRINWQKNFCYL